MHNVIVMINLRRNIPPLGSLVAFEAAARHESFARAAGELHVTPAAVRNLRREWILGFMWEVYVKAATPSI